MDKLIFKSTKWTKFVTKSTKNIRIYQQVQQMDGLISMSTSWTNFSLEVHKVDKPATKKWTTPKKDRSTTKLTGPQS